MSTEHNEVNRTVVDWETTISSIPHTFPIEVFDSIDSQSCNKPVINLNGIGEGRYSASIAPKILGKNVMSPILPFRGELELTPANIERIAVEVPEIVALDGLRRINTGRDKSEHHASASMIARSQGGAPGIKAALQNETLFPKLALVMPFGLNNEQLGSTTEQRRQSVLRRLFLVALLANPFDYGNIRSSIEVGGYMIKGLSNGSLFPSLDAALSFNLVDDLKDYADRHEVAVLMGKSDPLFKGKELGENLSGSKVELITVVGGHNTPGSRKGKQHLSTAYDWLTRNDMTK